MCSGNPCSGVGASSGCVRLFVCVVGRTYVKFCTMSAGEIVYIK